MILHSTSDCILKLFNSFFMCTQVKERICRLIQAGVDSGARLVLDGGNIEVCLTTYLSMIILLDFFWSNQSFSYIP